MMHIYYRRRRLFVEILALALFCSHVSSQAVDQTKKYGYRFLNSASFAELPPESLCGNQFSFGVDFAISRSPYTLMTVNFPAADLEITGDRLNLNLTLRSDVDSEKESVTELKMALSQTRDFHELALDLKSRKLSIIVDGRNDSTLLGRASLASSDTVDKTRVYLGRPTTASLQPWQRRNGGDAVEQESSRPGFEGVLRNIIGQRVCDCLKNRHLPLIAAKGVDLRKTESCFRRNPCSDDCLCISLDRDLSCRCDPERKCKKMQVAIKPAAVNFENKSPTGRYLSDYFFVSAHGDVQSQPNGKVGKAVSIAKGAFIDLGAHYGCYGDLERCPNGITIRLWLRPHDLTRPRAFILSSRSYDLFSDSLGRLNVYFKTQTRTWKSFGKIQLKQGVWQLLVVSWSTDRGLVVDLDGSRVESVNIPLSIDTKLSDDPKIYVGGSVEKSAENAGGFDLDELEFSQQPPKIDDRELKKNAHRLEAKAYEMEVTSEGRLKDRPTTRVTGDPRKVPFALESKSGLEFSSKKRQFVYLGRAIICDRDDTDTCPRGFLVRLWIFPQFVDQPYDLLFSSLVQIRLENHRLVVLVNGKYLSWRATLPRPPVNRWSLLEVSWDRKSGLEVFVDTKRVASATKARDPRKSALFGHFPWYIGAGASGYVNTASKTSVRLAGLEVWPADIHKLRRLKKLKVDQDKENLRKVNEKPQAQPPVGRNGRAIEYLRFNGNYVRYNFNNLVHNTNDDENLRIMFSTTQPNGLLWFAQDGDESTYLYLRDGELVYEYRIYKKSALHTQTVKETMSLKPVGYSLTDGRRHTIDLARVGKRLTVTVDNNRNRDRMSQEAHGVVRLLVRNYMYLGGVEDPTKLNTQNFRGRLYEVKLRGNRNPPFDLIEGINTLPNENSAGSSIIVYVRPVVPEVIINPKPVIPITGGGGGTVVEDRVFTNILSENPIAYTFNSPDGLIRLPTWQFPRYKSMEIQFVTYEPRGVLFYAGPGRDGHKDFVAIEIFDGMAYFVYNHNDKQHHIQLSNGRVDNGQPQNVFFSIAKNGRMNARFNGREVPLPGVDQPHLKFFRSYTYIGSLDSFSPENTRAPWALWSREGFVGCVNWIRVNDQGYADARKFQNQHSTAAKRIGMCIKPARVFCQDGQRVCGNAGVCGRRWYKWRRGKNFHCDCSSTTKTKPATAVEDSALEVRGEACSEDATIVRYDGDTKTIISFTKVDDYVTHTDDISIRFKTQRYTGTIFKTTDITRRTFMKLYLKNGELYFATNVFDSEEMSGVQRKYRVGRGMYSDNQWHTVYIRRRANFLRTWVDNEPVKEVHFPETRTEDYRMKIKHIYLGNFNGTDANFVGSLSNFYWNPYDFLNNPTQENVYVVITTGVKPTIPPIPTQPPDVTGDPDGKITITKPTVVITIRPELEIDFESGRDTTMTISFRTEERNGLLFFMKGNTGMYVAAELVEGQLHYSYKLGEQSKMQILPYYNSLNDGKWHQLFIHFSSTGAHNVWIDRNRKMLLPITKKVRQVFRVYIAGVPASLWGRLPYTVRNRGRRLGFVGCVAAVVFNNQNNLLLGNNVDVYPRDQVYVGECRSRKECKCQNGGRCERISFDEIRCFCEGTGYRGENCDIVIPPPECPPGYCANGVCKMVNGRPYCDCRGTGYEGERCHNKKIVDCPPNYCKNGGRCKVEYVNQYFCDCSRTGWTGRYCTDKTMGIRIGYDSPGYVVYPVIPPLRRTEDMVTVGFQTWMKRGTLLTFMGPNGKYWSIVMRDGRLFLRLSNNAEYPLSTVTYNDGQYHVISMDRNKNYLSVSVDGNRIADSNYFGSVIDSNDGSLVYSKIIVGANHRESDIFRGVLGGFYWNGKYPISKVPDTNKKGVVVITVTPVPLPKPLPPPACTSQFCYNGGECYVVGREKKCNCSRVFFYGDRCRSPVFGIRTETRGPGGYIRYIVRETPPPIDRSGIHRFRLGLQTWELDGPLIRFMGKNNNYWELILRDGYLALVENGNMKLLRRDGSRRINNGELQNIQMEVRGSFLTILLNGRVIDEIELEKTLTADNYNTIWIGTDLQQRNSFRGVLGGFLWNGRRIFVGDGGTLIPEASKGGAARIVTIPQILIKPPITTPKPKPPLPVDPPASGAQGGAIWGAVGVTGDGSGPLVLIPGPSGNSFKGGAMGGGAIVMAGAGPIVAGASFLSGIGSINALAAGLVLAALLLASALLWACWRCKPGWLPCCAGAGAGAGAGRAGYARIPAVFGKPFGSLFAGGKAGSAAAGAGAGAGAAAGRATIVKVDATDVGGGAAAGGLAANGGLASSSAREMHTLNLQSAAAGGADNISVKSVPVGYSGANRFDYFRSDVASDAFGHSAGGGYYRGAGGGPRLDVTADRFGTMGSTYHMEAMGVPAPNMSSMETTTLTTAAAHTLGNNVFLNEEIKVDCCQISANSKYVVTGSSTGPPQVWDMKTGDLIKVMDGHEVGCTDLHLACGDSVLVAQVLDDIAATESMMGGDLGRRQRRLQLWDFATGRSMEMPIDIMCTASCVTWAGEHVVVSRMDAGGPSILVWDLFANEAAREIRYHHPAGMSPDSGMTFLAVTPDDQLVVSGFVHSGDGQANYLVFDLDGPGGAHVPINPLHVAFDANLDCTELLATPHEAVTGNRKGELFIWDLGTGKTLRQMTISAQLERAGTHNLPPHNGEIRALSLSRDGQYLVTGSTDRMVKVWSMLDEKMILSLDGHTDDILTACISDDNEVIVSGSWDGSIRVWRMRDGSQMCWFTSNIEVFNVKISHDKQAIVALGERGGHRKLIMLQILRNRTRRTRPRIASAR